MNIWHLAGYYDGESFQGRLIDNAEYAAVIDVNHLYDDWTVRDYGMRREADPEAVWKYGTYENLKEAAVRQWLKIGYLSWGGGSVLKIDGEIAVAIEGKTG